MPADPTTDFPVVARFEIRRRRYLAEDGTPVHPLPASLPEPQSLIMALAALGSACADCA